MAALACGRASVDCGSVRRTISTAHLVAPIGARRLRILRRQRYSRCTDSHACSFIRARFCFRYGIRIGVRFWDARPGLGSQLLRQGTTSVGSACCVRFGVFLRALYHAPGRLVVGVSQSPPLGRGADTDHRQPNPSGSDRRIRCTDCRVLWHCTRYF